MIRYCKQRNGYCCGPVLLLNILKWAGGNLSYDLGVKFFSELLKTTENGTTYENILKVIRMTVPGYIRVDEQENCSKDWEMKSFIRHLKSGGAAAVFLQAHDGVHHVCLFVYEWGNIVAVNSGIFNDDDTRTILSENQVMELLKRESSNPDHCIILLDPSSLFKFHGT